MNAKWPVEVAEDISATGGAMGLSERINEIKKISSVIGPLKQKEKTRSVFL